MVIEIILYLRSRDNFNNMEKILCNTISENLLLRGISMMKPILNEEYREYKKRLRLKLFYYLDVVGLDHLDTKQQEEFEKIIVDLGIRKGEEDSSSPVSFDFAHFKAEDCQYLLDLGYKIKEIQEMCGVSREEFYYWRKKNGLLKFEKKRVEKCE